MSYKEYRDREEKLEAKLNAMSNEEYDKYMCETYPDFFRQRGLDMSQTCMCWGFSIGNGWHYILDKACREAKLMQKLTGVKIEFEQIKEKFGTARFYYSTDTSECDKKVDEESAELAREITSMIIDHAERKTDNLCAHCGEHFYHKNISIYGWVYDLCSKCFVKLHPERADLLKKWEEACAAEERLQGLLWYLNDEEMKEIDNIVEKCSNRLNKR